MKAILRRLDGFQRERDWIAFPFAVVKKFGEDKAGKLAALVAYYGFFSLFPLLLVFVTVLGMVLAENPGLRDRILDSALTQFPVIGEDIGRNIGTIRGRGVALAVGLVGALWAGLGGIKALENAMNQVWDVPEVEQQGFVRSMLRALLMLGILGTASVVAAFSGSVGSGADVAVPLRAAAIVLSLILNFAVFVLAFRILTDADVSWADVIPGAAAAAVGWGILQIVGGYYLANQVRNAGDTYGVFAIVIGLLTWLFLGAQLTLLAAEVNVVRARRLWPRALSGPPFTEADRRALAAYAKAEEREPEERIEVGFDDRERQAG